MIKKYLILIATSIMILIPSVSIAHHINNPYLTLHSELNNTKWQTGDITSQQLFYEGKQVREIIFTTRVTVTSHIPHIPHIREMHELLVVYFINGDVKKLNLSSNNSLTRTSIPILMLTPNLHLLGVYHRWVPNNWAQGPQYPTPKVNVYYNVPYTMYQFQIDFIFARHTNSIEFRKVN